MIGNGSGILFREYCFGDENSLSLTEFYGKLGVSSPKITELGVRNRALRNCIRPVSEMRNGVYRWPRENGSNEITTWNLLPTASPHPDSPWVLQEQMPPTR